MNPVCRLDTLGNKMWYVGDQLHREDGPAEESVDGKKAYWLNDVEYSFEEWNRLRKMPGML